MLWDEKTAPHTPATARNKESKGKKEKGARTRDRVSENLKSKNQAVNLFRTVHRGNFEWIYGSNNQNSQA